MNYMPLVESMDQLDGGPLGESHVGILFGNIKAAGRVEYAYLFVVYHRDDKQPVFIVSSEVNAMRVRGGGGPSHFLCVFDGAAHLNLGASDDWADLDKFFPKALAVVEERLGLKPDVSPRRPSQ